MIEGVVNDDHQAVVSFSLRDEPAVYSPNAEECGRCSLTAEHCSERTETAAGRVTKEPPGGIHNAC